MRSQTRILLATLLLGPAVVWGPSLPELLSHMETFRISDVQVRGLRFLTEEAVVAQLQLGPFASVWGDRVGWEERVAAHPLVRSARIRRRLPNGLLVIVEERRPIALAGTPILEPVDAEGYRLPIDPTRYRLDLPVIATDRVPPGGSSRFPAEVRAIATEVGWLMSFDEEFVRRASAFEWIDEGALVVSLVTPDVDFVLPFRTPVSRLREAEAALSDAISRNPGRVPIAVDLRFADQVVVRRNRNE